MVTVIVGKFFGDTPDHSVTCPSLELKVPTGTNTPASFLSHAW